MKRHILLILGLLGISANAQQYILDPTFGNAGTISLVNNEISPSWGTFENNKYYLFGNDIRFARYNYDGTLDSTFGAAGFKIVNFGEWSKMTNAKLHNGKIYGIGESEVPGQMANALIIRLTADGQMDATFGNNGVAKLDIGLRETFSDIVFNADDSFYTIGTKTSQNTNNWEMFVARFHADGSLDTSFNSTGYKIFPYSTNRKGSAIRAFENGFLLGCWTTNANASGVVMLLKIDSAGNLMPDYGNSGEMAMSVNIFGSIIATNPYLMYFSENTVVTQFYWGTGANSQGSSAKVFNINAPNNLVNSPAVRRDSYSTVLSDGKMIVTGGMQCPYSCYSQEYLVKRYNADGTLDASFSNNGSFTYSFLTNPDDTEGALFTFVHEDGRVFIAGRANNKLCMLRIQPTTLATENFTQQHFTVHPNPASEILHLNNPDNLTVEKLQISDISGKIIETKSDDFSAIDISKLQSGIYFLTIDADGKSSRLKFIKS